MVNLQTQLAYLREQAAHRCLNTSAAENSNEKYLGKPTNFTLPQDLQSWLQMENSNMGGPQFLPNLSTNSSTTQYYGSTTLLDPNLVGIYENSGLTMEESISVSNFDESCSSMSYDMQKQWAFHEVHNIQ